MKKRDLIVAAVVMLSLALSTAPGFGAVISAKPKNPQASKTKAPEAAVAKAKVKVEEKEMTRDQMLAELKDDLSSTDEIFDAVQELKAVKGPDGKTAYTYNGAAIESLSKDDLAKLYGRTRQALVKIRTDRIQRQMETIRQAQMLQNVNVARQPPKPPPATPSAYKIPSPPPSAPRIPSVPPSASQRR